jgi:hypothetical protein
MPTYNVNLIDNLNHFSDRADRFRSGAPILAVAATQIVSLPTNYSIPNYVSPILYSVTSGCPGQNVILAGKYFPIDSIVRFFPSNQVLPTISKPISIDGVNYYMEVQIPTYIPLSGENYEIYVTSVTHGNSQTTELTIPSNCIIPQASSTLTIDVSGSLPIISSYNGAASGSIILASATTGQQIQFQAIINTYTSTSSSSSIVMPTWYVNNILGGNSSYGYIDNSSTSSNGTYTAPGGIGSSSVVNITATYAGNNINPLIANTYVQLLPTLSTPSFVSIPGGATSTNSAVVITDSLGTSGVGYYVNVPGPQIQFYAQLYYNGNIYNIQPTQWYIDGIAGGDSIHGYIDSNGLYTPPAAYIPKDFRYTLITAKIPFSGNPNFITNPWYLSYQPSSINTGAVSQITVMNQININFGDSRYGYIPAGSQIQMNPGDYLYAIYTEYLDQSLNPVFSNIPSQEMSLATISAFENSLILNANIYNQGQLTKTTLSAISQNIVLSSPYTVLLGTLDPDYGQFQSMWDLIPVIVPADTYATGVKPPWESGELSINLKSKEVFDKNSKKIMITGNVVYHEDLLIVSNKIKIFEIDIDGYNLLKTIDDKEIKIKDGSILYLINENDEWDLRIASINDILPENLRIFILGIVNKDFYSFWPTLICSKTKLKTKENYFEINNIITQWGHVKDLQKGKIIFENNFSNNYTIKSSNLLVNNKNLNGFNFSIINPDFPGFWMVIGS